MISSDIVTLITYNKNDEERIIETSNVLHEILSGFSKAGGATESEQDEIKSVIGIIDKILSGESFQ